MMVDFLEIIKRKDIATANGHWLEALTMAHLFIETQLNIIVSSHCKAAEIEKAQRNHVWGLGNLARDKGLITAITRDKIMKTNKNRNQTIHGLINDEITYDEIEQHLLDANELISELQRHYVTISIGSEIEGSE